MNPYCGHYMLILLPVVGLTQAPPEDHHLLDLAFLSYHPQYHAQSHRVAARHPVLSGRNCHLIRSSSVGWRETRR